MTVATRAALRVRGGKTRRERVLGRARALASGWGHLALLAVPVALNLWLLRDETTVVGFFSDSSNHLAMVQWARQQIDEGHVPLDGWYPFLGLGNAQFHRYQSLPHILTAYASLLFGTTTAFSWSLYLLLALWPLSVYACVRLFGFDRWAAVAAAVLAPVIVSNTAYGFEDRLFVWWGHGAWSALWGMWLLPLSWGLTWRAVDGRARWLAPAALALALTLACHFLTGYLAGLGLGVWVLARPSQLVRRALRAGLTGTGALLIASWVVVPLLGDSGFLPRSEYDTGTFWIDSYGAPQVLSWLFTGQIYDSGRLPVLTALVGVGLLLSLFRWPSDRGLRALTGAWALSLVLYSGRPTFGPLLALLPFSSDLYLHRMVMGMHLAGVLLAAVAAVWLLGLARSVLLWMARWLVSRLPEGRRALGATASRAVAVAGIAAAASAYVLPAWDQLGEQRSWVPDLKVTQQIAEATDGADVDALIDMARGFGDGRVFGGSAAGWGGDYKIGYVPVYNELTNKGVDSIGFTLRVNSLMADSEVQFDDHNLAQYDLFNIRYLILPSSRPPSVPATLVAQKGSQRLYRVDTSGYLEVVDTVGPGIVEDRSSIGRQSAGFLTSANLALRAYQPVAYNGAPAAEPTLNQAPRSGDLPGSVAQQTNRAADGVFAGDVVAHRTAVVLLKASYDPHFVATVDGVPAPIEMLAPALMGVRVEPGQHHVIFEYRAYPNYGWLFAVGGVALAALALGARWIDRVPVRWAASLEHRLADGMAARVPWLGTASPVRARLLRLRRRDSAAVAMPVQPPAPRPALAPPPGAPPVLGSNPAMPVQAALFDASGAPARRRRPGRGAFAAARNEASRLLAATPAALVSERSLSALVGVVAAGVVWLVQGAGRGPLAWDEAERVEAGWHLSYLLRNGDLAGAWQWLNSQTFYPFGMPSLHGLLMLVGAPPEVAGWIPALVAFALVIYLIPLLARELGAGIFGRWLAVGVFLLIPLEWRLAPTAMTEIPGLCVYMALLLALARLFRIPRVRYAIGAGLLVALASWFKWDYGVIAGATLFLSGLVTAISPRLQQAALNYHIALATALVVVGGLLTVNRAAGLQGLLNFSPSLRPGDRDPIYLVYEITALDDLWPLVAAALLSGAITGIVLWLRRPAVRPAILFVFISYIAYTLENNRGQPRYLAPALGVLAVLGAVGIETAVRALLARYEQRFPARWWQAAAALLALALVLPQLPALGQRLDFVTSDSPAWAIHDFAITNMPDSGPVAYVGASNEVSTFALMLGWESNVGFPSPQIDYVPNNAPGQEWNTLTGFIQARGSTKIIAVGVTPGSRLDTEDYRKVWFDQYQYFTYVKVLGHRGCLTQDGSVLTDGGRIEVTAWSIPQGVDLTKCGTAP